MPRTPFQQKVIDTCKTNLIVSAGAGSGKTSTLTDRVINVIKEGTSINNILALTFTTAASNEMKERIRHALVKEKMYDELTYLDSSYICTFDSFALSIVKKYYYVLGVDKHIDICEQSLINVVVNQLARETLDEAYKEGHDDFKKLVKDFLIKDDNSFLKAIIKINNELDKLVDKDEFIYNYSKTFSHINKLAYFKELYTETLKDKLIDLVNAMELVYLESDDIVGEKIRIIIDELKNASTYEDIYDSLVRKSFPRKNKDCSPRYSLVREKMGDVLKKYKTFLRYEYLDDFDLEYHMMEKNAFVFMGLVDKLNKKIKAYKSERKLYTFSDVAKMAIDLLKNNEDIRLELKDKFKEIMIDEYQDTSDIQESLINLLSSNNVCVVGDIKQSIYRFRNANPIIFKEKYDTYGKIPNTERIDLLDNFRSRKEVVEDVNLLFSDLMLNRAGGANYKEEHMMVFGNKMYETYKANQDYHMDIIDYSSVFSKKGNQFSKGEIEAFIIANDIKDKINNKYQIFDTKSEVKGLRDARYSDFCILLPTSTNFSIYKKVFEYLGIPLSILKKDSLIDGDEVLTLKNVLLFINSIYNNTFDQNCVETKHQYLSIARSFLFEEDDSDIFDCLNNGRIKDSEIYKMCYEISSYLNVISISEFINLVINKFDFVSKYNKLGGILKMLVEGEYLSRLSNSLEKANIGIEGFVSYLNDVLENNEKIEFDSSSSAGINAVNLMVIHKSKGLEFQVVYLASNTTQYNQQDTKSRFVFDPKLGLICPVFDYGVKTTFMKDIYNHLTLFDERAEKIRLFYVAVTRAKEKIIIVDNIDYEKLQEGFENDNDILQVNSFSKLLHGMYYKLKDRINFAKVDNLSKAYLDVKIVNGEFKDFENIDIEEYKPLEKVINEEKHFSKREYKLIDKETSLKMDFGTKIHEIMEYLNFKDRDIINVIDSLEIDDFYKIKIKKFVNSEVLKNIENGKVYKEYSFYDEKNNSFGIIDLMIEYDDYIDIIDYKLKNINDEAYFNQLKGYRDYIYKLTLKKVNIYLYSIIDEKLINLV